MKTFVRVLSLLALWVAVFAAPLAISQMIEPAPSTPSEPEAVPALNQEPAAEAAAPVVEAAEEVAVAEEPLVEPDMSDVAEVPEEADPVLEVPTEDEEADGVSVSTDEGEGQGERISVTLDNVPLQDVVRMFTRISGANIVAGTNLTGNVTVNLQDVEWEPALRVILDSAGMALIEKSPTIFMIVSKNELESEPVVSETIFLNYTSVSNVLPVVNSMLVSSNASAVGFPGANAVIVKETISRQKLIKEVVTKIDKPREQVLIEAKFVELNDEAIKNIGINWQVLQGYTVGIQSPQMSYSRTEIDSGGHDKETINRDLRQDAQANLSNQSSLSQNNANSQSGFNSSAGSSTSSGSGVPPTVTDSTSDSAFNSANRSKVSESLRSSQTINVGGRNFTTIDAETGALETVPKYDQTITDTILNSVETIKATTAILSADQFALTLSALKEDTGVTVVSDPKVVVANGETATIHVGEQRPNIRALPQGTQTITYSYELDQSRPFIDLGVKINVTPTINNETNISVRIVPELTREIGQIEPTPGQTFPILSTTRVVTDFSLESGKTVAIGGLTRTGDSERVVKIPVLGDIPIIGTYLFRHTSREKSQSEVIIFVTMSMAKPSTLQQTSGIPEDGELIHRHLARKAEKALKAEQTKAKESKKKTQTPRSN